MKRVLILYAKYGGGHQSAANSIQTYIEDHYFYNARVESYDCMDYTTPFFSSLTTDAYKNLAKKAPKLWEKIYYGSKSGLLDKISRSFNKKMAMRLYNLFKHYLPDVVISTHPFATQMTSYLKQQGLVDCELATILTDFAPHDQWLVGKEFGDYFFVSNEIMKQTLINQYNIPEEKIHVTGIPLANTFSYPFYDNDIYRDYRLKKDKKTILFFGGGEFGLGHKRTVKILHSLAKHLDKYQIVAISGRNKRMNKEFLKLYKKVQNEDLHVIKYTHDVPDLMHISSVVVTKPGGLTSSESLTSQLPIIVISPIPGQEEENAEFLENSGAAVWLKDDDDIDETLNSVLDNDEKLEKMKQCAIAIAKPNSTKDICYTVLGRPY